MDGRVIVIGGGIGGLTAARALQVRGVECTVYERAPALAEIGAGLGLWPAVLRLFDELGLGEEVRALSGRWQVAGLRRADGRYLMRYTAEQFTRRFGECTIGVHRGELQQLLLRSLRPGTVRTGAECVGVVDDGGLVTARFADGGEATGVALVAADGRRSAVRRLLFDDRPLHRVVGNGWRGTALAPEGSDWHEFAGETWGTGGRFGILPLSGGRVSWYAAAREVRDGGGKAELLDRFGAWHHPIPELLAATPDDAIWLDGADDLTGVRPWTKGRVALLGDAAHPMTPDLGQGACQAIMDGWVLADELAGATDGEVAAALGRYERRRRRRAAMVTRIARTASQGAAGESAAAVAMRSLGARLVPVRLALGPLALVTAGP